MGRGEGEEGRRGKRGTGPEGERGGKNEGKRVGGKGPKAYSKNSDFGTPMIEVLVAFHFNCKQEAPNCTPH